MWTVDGRPDGLHGMFRGGMNVMDWDGKGWDRTGGWQARKGGRQYGLSNVLIRQAWMTAVDGMVTGCTSSLPYLLT